MVAIFLFHRDLRLRDNTTLIKAIESGTKVLPLFVFTPEQIDSKKNEHFSDHAVQYMCESLKDLDANLQQHGSKLTILYGDTLKVLASLKKQIQIESLYTNKDVSAYAVKRDAEIAKWCKNENVSFISEEDYGLLPLNDGLLSDGRPYKILSQYYKNFLKIDLVRPVNKKTFNKIHFVSKEANHINSLDWKTINNFYITNPNQAMHGGRSDVKRILSNITNLKNYGVERDMLGKNGTSKASAALKFGVLSIREFYWEIRGLYGKENDIIRQLVFRDMYQKIFALNPELQKGVAYYDKIDKAVPWKYSKIDFERWCKGETGFPLVDAGMRELNTTGWMHNRARLVVSSFLTQYLLIDWRWGARYFSQKLIDGDIFNNTAGWMTNAAVFPNGAPYYRPPINPFLQSKKNDPNTEYILKWIPELKGVESRDIHHWYDIRSREKYPNITYKEPMIEQSFASHRAIDIFRKAYKNK